MPINDRAFYLKYAEALKHPGDFSSKTTDFFAEDANINVVHPFNQLMGANAYICLLYTSPSPRDAHESRMPSSA